MRKRYEKKQKNKEKQKEFSALRDRFSSKPKPTGKKRKPRIPKKPFVAPFNHEELEPIYHITDCIHCGKRCKRIQDSFCSIVCIIRRADRLRDYYSFSGYPL